MLGVDQNNCFDYDSVPVCAEMRGNLRNPRPIRIVSPVTSPALAKRTVDKDTTT